MIWVAAVIVWAAAEASFFFVLPDVLLTYIALRFGLRSALKLAATAALTASLVGGLFWFWAHQNIWLAREVMTFIPAIGPDLIDRASDEMKDGLWPLHMIVGAATGVPYKIYAIEAGAAQISLLPFLLASFVARVLRFAGTIILAHFGHMLLLRLNAERFVYWGWGLAWLIVYAIYFSLRGVL